MNTEKILRSMFEAAVDAAMPANSMTPFLPERPEGRLIVIGAGKASAAMAQAVEAHYVNNLSGKVIVPYGSKLPCKHIDIVEARHPVPDDAGEAAGTAILQTVDELGENDLVLCLISGGGSALLSVPGSGILKEEKQAINQALLASGAAIDEMNCVRKHLSSIKGGRLAAAAYPARVVTLTISDVPGDDVSVIASGPTVPDESTTEQALAIIERYSIRLPESAKRFLAGTEAETPEHTDARMQNLTTHLVCTPQKSLEAAARVAEQHGYTAMILGDAIEGEAREAAKVMAGIAKQVCKSGQPLMAPAVLISGGETTVTVKGDAGRGGRNTEFLLALAHALDDTDRVHAIACDTDGIDGNQNCAGALWLPRVAAKAQSQSLKKTQFLDKHDACSYFEACEALVVTGPTHTNVNDFRAILITSD